MLEYAPVASLIVSIGTFILIFMLSGRIAGLIKELTSKRELQAVKENILKETPGVDVQILDAPKKEVKKEEIKKILGKTAKELNDLNDRL